jgi:DNA-binding NtrC family response regulator
MVLIAAQQEAIRSQLRDFLRRRGLRTIEVGHPSEINAVVAPDTSLRLLIGEFSLPQGPEAWSGALRGRPAVKALLISGDPEEISRETFPHPRVEFIEKPFAWRDLGERIDNLLARPVGLTA